MLTDGEQVNAYNGHVTMRSVESDGGFPEMFAPILSRAPESVSAIATGSTVLTAFSEFNTNDKYTLGVFATSADFSGDGSPASFSPTSPGWWSLGRCGAGCVGLGVMAFEEAGPAWIGFFSDDSSMSPRGSWDVVCSLQPQELTGSTISLAGYGGRLGVLITAATSAKLYLCDMPPLP